jgi:glucuronoarabinoxylan endo-1,4-beta-xylanase
MSPGPATKEHMRVLRLFTTSALLFAALVGAATVTINPATVYQTIDGFGAYGAMQVYWTDGPFYNDQFLDLVVNDLGMTINRNEMYPDIEPSNDNDNPLTYGSFNTNSEFHRKQRGWVNALQAKADESGEPMKFIVTYWSPPFWMKANNSEVGTDPQTNVLRNGFEQELGELGAATVKAYKDECNVDLYALSMQNEPGFAQPYNSCVYTFTRYRDVFKVFANRVHADYPDVKLFGAEHMLEGWGQFEGQLMVDTAARRHIDVFAVHGYSDGVHPTPTSAAATMWTRAWLNSSSAGKPLWMTETSGFGHDWAGAQGLADAIFAALKYGHISAWVYWVLSGTHTAHEVLMLNGVPDKQYYVSKQFFRYIRPGAKGIGAESDDPEVAVVAFHHAQQQTLTLVLMNWSSVTKQVTITGTGLPQFSAYRTSSSQNCAAAGTVGAETTLPPGSITTLYGSNYAVSAARSQGNIVLPRGACHAELYGLDGRLVARVNGARTTGGRLQLSALRPARATGVYCARVTDHWGISAPSTTVLQHR